MPEMITTLMSSLQHTIRQILVVLLRLGLFWLHLIKAKPILRLTKGEGGDYSASQNLHYVEG